MAGVVSIMVVTGNSQNSMNKKWKLAFTPCLAGPLSLCSFPVSLSLVQRSRSQFVEGTVVVGGQKEKSKGRKEFNIKKLSFCVDMKIPRISASSDVCFLHSFLRICFAYIAVLFAFLHLHLCIFIFTAADSLPGALIVWQDPPPTDK